MQVQLMPSTDSLRWVALLVMTAIISLAFFDMVQPFLMALFLAAITAQMCMPLYRWLMKHFGGKAVLSSILTLIALALAVVLPLLWLVALVAEQASGLAPDLQTVMVEAQERPIAEFVPTWMPFHDQVVEALPEIAEKLGEATSQAGAFLVSSLTTLGRGTATFFLDLFIYFYALFFFLQMDVPIIDQVLGYSGVRPDTQERLSERMSSVSRATIKGTLLIGIAQGALVGIGFWAVGIEGAPLWGFVAAILSVIPGVGPTLVVAGGVVYLLVQGQTTAGIGLAVWGMAVVGTIDNVLRPILVGRDARMHDIMILISTLGGLAAFGAAGLVVGPVLAGLFVTIWQTVNERAGVDVNGGASDTPKVPDVPEAPGDAEPAPSSLAEDPVLEAEVAALRRRVAERKGRE